LFCCPCVFLFFCRSVGRSAGRSERRFLRDDDASERARASFDVPPEREPMTMVRARPRDANINAASTTYSFFRSLHIIILYTHTLGNEITIRERVGFFSSAHASSSSAELVPLVCFHRGLEKYTSISPTLSGMYSVKFSFCPVVVLPIAYYISIPSSSTSSSLEPPPPYLEMVIFIIFINNNNGQTTIRPDKLEFESVPLPPPRGGEGRMEQ
jgi:hypothetical protein